MLPKGTILGHYRLLQRIGAGGMGEVYLGEDTRIARNVAIKIVLTEPQPYPNSEVVREASRLFRREMKAIAMLDHRNILNLIDFGEEIIEGMPVTYMIMPYRREGSLNDWLQQYKPNELLSLDDVDHILTQAADALQHAHEHHIIHQDVKPSNFLIRENSNNTNRPDLLLTDFGVAKITNTTATASQHVRGTPAFMSPEQWEGEAVPATDQYALGVLAYLLLAGRAPFVGRMEQVMRQHLMTTPLPLTAHNSHLSPAIDAVILRALEKKPEERFPSVLDFARAFHQAILYSGDLRTTLTISTAEATTGVERSITLPGGRSVSIKVPQNACDGQELRVENQGDPYYDNGPRGPLLLKIAVPPGESTLVSKNDKENVPSTDSSSLPSTVYAWQKQSNQLPPTVTVPPSPPLEPTKPAISEKPGNEKPVMSPSLPVGSASGLPQSTRDKRTRKPVVTVISFALVFIVIVAGIAGIAHQTSVNTANVNATATANTIADDNANATATANVTATDSAANANALASVLANETATATINHANPDPYGVGGTLALIDPLTQEGNWFNQSDSNNSSDKCQFMSDGYHLTEQQKGIFECDVTQNFVNLVFEVKMTINQGNCGGMNVRGYNFVVCSDGTYQFIVEAYNGGSKNGSNSGIVSGPNTIAVVASGNNFTLYLNHTQLGSFSDGTFTGGSIGLIANYTSNSTEVTYRDARVWTL